MRWIFLYLRRHCARNVNLIYSSNNLENILSLDHHILPSELPPFITEILVHIDMIADDDNAYLLRSIGLGFADCRKKQSEMI